MCLAAYLSPGAKLTTEQIESAWRSNPDGGGFGWSEKGKVHVLKFKLLKPFTEALLEHMESKSVPTIVHFRWATHGDKEKGNVHPFFVNEDLLMCHNGVIGIRSESTDDAHKSDTKIFSEYILSTLPKNFFRNYGIMWLLEEAIGSDKMIFLHKSGEVVIANETKGHWNTEKTIWFSNHSYEAKVYRWLKDSRGAVTRAESLAEKYAENDHYKAYVNEDIHEYKVPYYEKCEFCNSSFNVLEHSIVDALRCKGELPEWIDYNDVMCDDCYYEYAEYMDGRGQVDDDEPEVKETKSAIVI